MLMTMTRRTVLIGGLALLADRSSLHAADRPGDESVQQAQNRIEKLEARHGGRLGVAVFDTASGLELQYRAGERFAMCSTFKFLAAAAVLKRVDDGEEQLDRRIPFGESDLDSYAPVTRQHLNDGGMSLLDLCAAAVVWSDNTAGNLLLRALGGPQGVTRFARSFGDAVTRLDRTEPTLNTAIPGDERDTTSPAAFLQDMRVLLRTDMLSASSRRQLEEWMVAAKTGLKRIRAGVPPSWRVGDKTGTGENATANTVAILYPPGRPPILAAVFYTGSQGSPDDRNAVHAEIGNVIAELVSAG
jgi:beta-lactamase class A